MIDASQTVNQTDTQITNCTFTNNGLSSTNGVPVFMRLVGNLSNNATVTGCTFNKSGHATQKVNNLQGQNLPDTNGLQDTFPARFTVSGNTINP